MPVNTGINIVNSLPMSNWT